MFDFFSLKKEAKKEESKSEKLEQMADDDEIVDYIEEEG